MTIAEMFLPLCEQTGLGMSAPPLVAGQLDFGEPEVRVSRTNRVSLTFTFNAILILDIDLQLSVHTGQFIFVMK